MTFTALLSVLLIASVPAASVAPAQTPVAQNQPQAALQGQTQGLSKVTCDTALSTPVPTPTLDPALKPDCDSSASYFGIDRDKDFAAAVSCAYVERASGPDANSNIFAGPGVLSMAYANGEGVERNIDLARRFVCEQSFASPAEIDARLKVLARIAASPARPPHFDICGSATSGLSEGYCISIQARLNDAKRYTELSAIFTSLTPTGQEAYKALQDAETAFEDLRTNKEIDLTGSARAAFSLEEQDRLRFQFLADLKALTAKTYSQPVALAFADSKMNMEYASLQANAPKLFVNTTLTFEGVQQTQTAWLKLREAWRHYAGLNYPTVSGDAVVTQLTRERYTQLKKLNTY